MPLEGHRRKERSSLQKKEIQSTTPIELSKLHLSRIDKSENENRVALFRRSVFVLRGILIKYHCFYQIMCFNKLKNKTF